MDQTGAPPLLPVHLHPVAIPEKSHQVSTPHVRKQNKPSYKQKMIHLRVTDVCKQLTPLTTRMREGDEKQGSSP
jgi:hypothetical protein